jgi:DNA topoisomerase VI B subunit
MPPKKSTSGDKNLKSKSPAEFFLDNKGIAGFENAGKSLYTTLREFIENSLDSAESIGVLPDVDIAVEEVTLGEYEDKIGLKTHVRKDNELYADFETDKERAKRLAAEAKKFAQDAKAAQDALTKAASTAKGGKGGGKSGGVKNSNANTSDGNSKRDNKGKTFFRITVKDNGKGMQHDDIPNMLGRVLSGTKYGVRQTRGKFGLGSKMALIWSKQTTGLPIEIMSAQPKQKFCSRYVLDIDIERNEPNVHSSEKIANPGDWHGAELSVIIEGNWTAYRNKVLSYLRQLAIVTPYAQFHFKYVSAGTDVRGNVDAMFRRRTSVMPAPPSTTKHHPSAANEDQLLIKTLLSQTKEKTLQNFFYKEFTSIAKEHAGRLVAELGKGFDPSMSPRDVTETQATRIQQLLSYARFADPSGDCLSPAGEYNLRLGIMKELAPDWIASYVGGALACGGHPLIVEACVSLGGKDVKAGHNVFRFANRIPLLFEAGSDVVTRCVQRLNWGSYKIDKNNDKIGIFVSIVSTKIPFKGTSKEYIGDDNVEIAEAVDRAIRACATQLKGKIVRAQAAKERRARKKVLSRYIPDCARAISAMLEQSAAAAEPPSKRARHGDQVVQGSAAGGSNGGKLWEVDSKWESDVLGRVRDGQVTLATIQRRLEEHVERIDSEQALEYSMQNKEGLNEAMYLMPIGSAHAFVPIVYHPTCVFRLLDAAKRTR